jgi:hypothetical protein
VAVASGLEELEDAVPATRIALSDDVIRTAVARLRESAIEEAREQAAAGALVGVMTAAIVASLMRKRVSA